ncbi:MAG TPA: nucleotidyl transferase AbiEii/AbiGii toxin family protein [Lentisphaeria bacterium]|nr:MAG: hypothetical protein A2X48_07435 [Lentisphaerae bacterium GWF2_49_21]HBC86474.1 nucleotidyl transferase AbiEii/AbiGii toxin family protein [Lentisphaeria bacterium]
MDNVAILPESERRGLFSETAAKVGLARPSIAEKDFWVCWTLKQIYSLPRPYSNVIFKGGTTLSKVYGLIKRFSEDIDIAVDRSDLGFTGERDPASPGLGRKKRKALVEDLVDKCANYVKVEFQNALENKIRGILGSHGGTWRIEPSSSRKGSLHFHYPRAFSEPAEMPGYAKPFILLEIGARAENWPVVDAKIRSYAAENFPSYFKEPECSASVLSAERTFWEKAFVLFRESCPRHEESETKERVSRHYYDIVMISRSEIAEKALRNSKLIEAVREFDQIFFRRGWIDYENAKPGTFRLLPSENKLNALKSDYDSMVSEMFFGPAPKFEELVDELKGLEKKINTPRNV